MNIMEKLPNEIIDIIYEKKHKLELNVLHDELKKYHSIKQNKIYLLIDIIGNKYEYHDILCELYTSLRNDYVIDDYELLQRLVVNDVFEEDIINHYINDTICMNEVLNKYIHMLTNY